MKLESRKAKSSDLTEILAIIKDNMKELFVKNFGGWSDDVSKKQFFQMLEKGNATIFEINNKIVGYCAFYSDEPELFVINDLHVKKRFQQKGIGRQIMEYIQTETAKKGALKLKAMVFENNPSIKFYEKHRFVKDSKVEKSSSFVMIKKNIKGFD